MGGFGDLLSGLGQLFGGLAEAVPEGAAELGMEAAAGAMAGDDARDANAVSGRYLTGAPRVLNINDI